MAGPRKLSQKSAAVLRLIADGRSYAQIVDSNADITYLDIFAAAEEALGMLESPPEYDERIAKVKQSHPRAYERWTEEEDRELTGMYREGGTVAEMADHLGRQPSAIRSRLKRLNLMADVEREQG